MVIEARRFFVPGSSATTGIEVNAPLTIIKATKVCGTLAEGTTITVATAVFQISYSSTTVVLTRLS
jgi:hypothetical protein